MCFITRPQIVKTQLSRFRSSEPIDFDKEKDPTQEHGDNDKESAIITLAIVFTAFIISPLTDCLGSVLELNVRTTYKTLNCLGLITGRRRNSQIKSNNILQPL